MWLWLKCRIAVASCGTHNTETRKRRAHTPAAIRSHGSPPIFPPCWLRATHHVWVLLQHPGRPVVLPQPRQHQRAFCNCPALVFGWPRLGLYHVLGPPGAWLAMLYACCGDRGADLQRSCYMPVPHTHIRSQLLEHRDNTGLEYHRVGQ